MTQNSAVQTTHGWKQKAYLYLVDHGFLRALYGNLHALPGGLYRSNQPSPDTLKTYRNRLRLKTVVNLRGGDPNNPAWQLEDQACRELGLRMVDVKLFSRSFPHRADVLRVKEVVESIEYPALAHCKSGADRAGLFSVLYRMFRLNEPPEIAMRELSLKYGHIRWARTGVLDIFFEQYLQARNQTGVSFLDWLESGYDREALKKNYPERAWIYRVGDFLVDRLLKRE